MAIVTLADVRAEGVTAAMADDTKVNSYITEWEATFVNTCQQWFDERAAVVTIDGDDSSMAFFQVPIITITDVLDLETSLSFSSTNYRVYNGRSFLQDDRRNPKIALVNGYSFNLGRARYQITGTFGYTESDGSAPPEVKRAMLTLIIEKLLAPTIITEDGPDLPAMAATTGGITEEVTDDHKIKYGDLTSATTLKAKANDGITQNRSVLEIMNRYRAPMKVRTQADWAFPTFTPRPSTVFPS